MNIGPILDTIRALGYRVTTHRMEGGIGFSGHRMPVPDRYVEMHAVRIGEGECLEKDRIELLASYDFPAEHWVHLLASNPIESTFATVRLRTYLTKGPGSRKAALAMAFKLTLKAEGSWRKLNGAKKLQELIDGTVFVDGIQKAA